MSEPVETTTASARRTVFVGAGLAQTLAMILALHEIADDSTLTGNPPVEFKVYEKIAERTHGGLAYGRTSKYPYKLNLSANRTCPFIGFGKRYSLGAIFELHAQFTGGLASMPTFEQWLQSYRRPRRASRANLVNPRRQVYGEYLKYLLDDALERAGNKVKVSFENKEVVDAALQEGEGRARWQVKLNDGAYVEAANIVATTGNMEDVHPMFSLIDRRRDLFLSSPYSAEADDFFDGLIQNQKQKAAGQVAIIGTGLTGEDIAARLRKSGYKGKIIMISRHGVLPHIYGKASARKYISDGGLRGEPQQPVEERRPAFMSEPTFEKLLAAAIKQFENQTSANLGRLGGYRDSTTEEALIKIEQWLPAIWDKFPDDREKMAKWLRDNKAIITAYRVGVTPDTGEAVSKGIRRKKIAIIAGRIKDIRPCDSGAAICYTSKSADGRISEETIQVDAVFSGLGRSLQYPGNDRFWRNLFSRGYASAHPAAGVEVDRDFHSIGSDSNPVPGLYVLGVPATGHMMLTDYPYAQRPGSGGRFSPFDQNIAGVTDGVFAWFRRGYKQITDPYRALSSGVPAAPAEESRAAARRANARGVRPRVNLWIDRGT